ncbi:MAG: Rpn family recombination-promoting nuclease/putative transposase [Ruminococcus sp.]|nr:Rpn family recombination-promoting nuclease/putative transposase [Ruminococcus sp.]
MADKDTITKDYMQDSETFADAFNFLIYGGKQVIKPEQLRPLDTTSIVLPYGDESKKVPIQRYRDVLKMVTAMEDDRAAYLLLGIENQSDIHYAMPIRNMLYDAIQYVNQADAIAKEHRKSKKMPETRAEYLSGFYKTDRILPIITLTLYFGADEWDAPRDLHSMLTADEDILRFVDNYHIHLIAPAEIRDEDFAKFHTELSLTLKYVKYSKDKKKLRDMVNEDAAFHSVSRKTADMVNVVTNSNLHYDNGEERVDMCEAIEGIRKDALAEGIEEGILKTLIGLVKDGILTIADAAKRANMTVSEFEEKTGLKA